MVEFEKCLDNLLKLLKCVETFEERKIVGVQEMKSLLMEFSREKENLLTMVVEKRLVIESLLLRVEKLEGFTMDSINGQKLPSMEVGMIVDENPSFEDGKINGGNPSKRESRENRNQEGKN